MKQRVLWGQFNQIPLTIVAKVKQQDLSMLSKTHKIVLAVMKVCVVTERCNACLGEAIRQMFWPDKSS